MAATAETSQPARRRQSTGALLKGYGLLAPAALWIALFFIVPLASMVIYSFWERRGSELITEFTTANYERFFSKWHFLKSLLNSLEVTGNYGADQHPARLPAGLHPGLQGVATLAENRASPGGAAVLDLVPRALLFLAAGAG